jgi:hypothetical protein
MARTVLSWFSVAIMSALVCTAGFFYQRSHDTNGGGAASCGEFFDSERDADSYFSRRLAVVKRRIEIRERIAQELVAGQMTLLQAAEQYRDLNGTELEWPDGFRSSFSGRNDDERLCRQVIDNVRAQFLEKPETGKQVVGRFERDLAKLMHDAEIKLPR